MKIVSAKVIVCSPGRNFVTLKIETDQGIYGLGDATLNGRELAVASYLEDHLIPCLIGRDPFQTEDIWHYFYRGAYWRRGPVTMTAQASGANVVLTWPGLAGQMYQMQYKTNLTDAAWLPLNSPVPGTGASLSLTNNLGGAPQRFYRLAILPSGP